MGSTKIERMKKKMYLNKIFLDHSLNWPIHFNKTLRYKQCYLKQSSVHRRKKIYY